MFKCVLASTAAEQRSPCQISNFSVGFWFQLSPSAAKKRQLKDSKNTRTHGYTHTACIYSEPKALNNGDVKLEDLFSSYTCVGLALKTGKSKRQTGENEIGSTLKADAPKGSVLQRICCTKNSDDKVFTERQMKKGELCINTRDNEAIRVVFYHEHILSRSQDLPRVVLPGERLKMGPNSNRICENN